MIQILTRMLSVLWVPLCAVSLVFQTRILAGLDFMPGWFEVWIVGSTAFAYHFTHENREKRYTAWIAGAVSGVAFLQLPTSISYLAPFAGALWGAYFLAMRSMPIAKPILVAGVWVLVTHFMPLPFRLWEPFFTLGISRFAFIFALALGYDLLDRLYDRQWKTDTLVLRLGGIKTWHLAGTALLLTTGLVCDDYLMGKFSLGIAFARLLPVGLSVLLIYYIQKNLTKPTNREIAVAKAALDGMMLLQSLLVCYFAMLPE